MTTSTSNAVELSSFIDSVVTDMATARRTSRRNADGELVSNDDRAAIAKLVQKQDHPNVLNRIAMTMVTLQADRRMASRAYRKVQLKPERMLSFVQDISNQCCWAARRLLIAQQNHEAEQQASGVDFSADVAEQVGVESVSTDRIAEVIESDAFSLGNLHSWLAGKMNYLGEIEDFHLYADRGPVDSATNENAWATLRFADTFNEAQGIMAQILDELSESQEAATGNEAQSLDFNGGQYAPTTAAD